MSKLSSEQTWLLGLPRFGQGPSLDRTQRLLEPLHLPPESCLAVTGSNGKGSTCRYLETMLTTLDLRPGVFTSPHVWQLGERFQVDGQPVSVALLDQCIADARQMIEQSPEGKYGVFETMLGTAVRCFAREQTRTGVFEVGIGGRWDPVRRVGARVAGLTAVELEHTKLLGETRREIALDKADLAPEGGVLVYADLGDDDLIRELRRHCQARHVRPVAAADWVRFSHLRMDDAGMMGEAWFLGRPRGTVRWAMPGRHQADNAAVAIGLLLEWNRLQAQPREPEALWNVAVEALKNTRIPGRCERLDREPPVYLDIAHTPESVRRFLEVVRPAIRGRAAVLLTGVSTDKRVEDILDVLAPLADTLVATRARHRGAPVARVAACLRACRPEARLLTSETLEEGLALASNESRRQGVPLIIAGGLFLAMEAQAILLGRSPEDLHFI